MLTEKPCRRDTVGGKTVAALRSSRHWRSGIYGVRPTFSLSLAIPRSCRPATRSIVSLPLIIGGILRTAWLQCYFEKEVINMSKEVDLRMCLGFDFANTFQIDRLTVRLDAPDIDAVASYAGSCHIHVMGMHFIDYVLSGEMPGMPTISGYPSTQTIQPLKTKVPGNDVLGNIGESAAAIVAQEVFDLTTGDIAHLKVSRVKTPDYAMRFRDTALIRARKHYPKCPQPAAASPEWWPVESKAMAGESRLASRFKGAAFSQLASYWKQVPNAAGFGMIFGFQHKSRSACPQIIVSLFLPKDQGRIQQILYPMTSKMIRKAHKNATLLGEIYGCQ